MVLAADHPTHRRKQNGTRSERIDLQSSPSQARRSDMELALGEVRAFSHLTVNGQSQNLELDCWLGHFFACICFCKQFYMLFPQREDSVCVGQEHADLAVAKPGG